MSPRGAGRGHGAISVLLGTGFHARKWLEALKAREDCEVVGIVSRTPARAEALRQDFALAEFLGAVREKRQPDTHVVEHLRSLPLVLAVAESSRRQAWVEVAEIQGPFP